MNCTLGNSYTLANTVTTTLSCFRLKVPYDASRFVYGYNLDIGTGYLVASTTTKFILYL